MAEVSRTYYQIRFTGDCHYFRAGGLYSSNNGTSQWNDLSKVKSLITRGIPTGYKGKMLVPFKNFEIIEIQEIIQRSERVITI
jgi:hypothetical protein